jgi:hypothetical protein
MTRWGYSFDNILLPEFIENRIDFSIARLRYSKTFLQALTFSYIPVMSKLLASLNCIDLYEDPLDPSLQMRVLADNPSIS